MSKKRLDSRSFQIVAMTLQEGKHPKVKYTVKVVTYIIP